MKPYLRLAAFVFMALLIINTKLFAQGNNGYCYTGAFLSNQLTENDIINFKNDYGKKPFLVMVFVDWGNFIQNRLSQDVHAQECALFISWEPWDASTKQAIDYDGLLIGKYDGYISDFSLKLKNIGDVVFLRFAHEMNGNWYPWSISRIGKEKYLKIFQYIRGIFLKNRVNNVRWVFSLNFQDTLKGIRGILQYYPGDEYVDYIGIDGYNWGNTKPASKWMSFQEIFAPMYNQIKRHISKPILISEFSSTSKGGDKAAWVRKAMTSIKEMPAIKGFVIFNMGKESDWSFPALSSYGREFKRQLQDPYFVDKKRKGL